jgi:hypothetical protein
LKKRVLNVGAIFASSTTFFMSELVNHLKPLRLFDIGRASGFPATEEEKMHLRDCEECSRILEVFARQFEKPFSPAPQRSKGGDAA